MEARALRAFTTTAAAADFPFVEQAARLTRCLDSDDKSARQIETEYLISSRPADELTLADMFAADRGHWGIETGLHLRLDVIAREDQSRVRHRTAALNLAMFRRAVVSVAVSWIRKCRNPRQATMSGFYDFMAAQQRRKAFSLVTVCRASWLRSG